MLIPFGPPDSKGVFFSTTFATFDVKMAFF